MPNYFVDQPSVPAVAITTAEQAEARSELGHRYDEYLRKRQDGYSHQRAISEAQGTFDV